MPRVLFLPLQAQSLREPVKVPSIAKLMRLATRTPLQSEVMALGVCPQCHSRTLVESGVNHEGRWLQCSKCRKLFAASGRGPHIPR